MTRKAPKRWSEISDLIPFTPEDLLGAVERLENHSNVLAVYIGGSIAEGFANKRSDVDAYALVKEGDLIDEVSGFEVSFINGKHIQFDFIPIAFVEKSIADMESKHPWQVMLSRMEIATLHRLRSALPVVGSELIESLREALTKSGLDLLCADRQARSCENSLQDTYGCIESNDWDSGLYAARSSAQRAIDAMACLLGETANNEKWIFPRVRRALGDCHPMALLWRAIFERCPLDGENDSRLAYIGHCMKLVDVCLTAYATAWVARSSQIPGLTGLVGQLANSISMPNAHRYNEAFLMPSNRGPVLYFRGRPVQEISTRAVAIWAAAGCSARLEEVADIATRFGSALFHSLDEATSLARRLVPAWERRGLLVHADQLR